MGNNNFLENASSYFDKIMKQKYVSKSAIISLKQKLKVLKESDDSYNNLFNGVTNIANKAKGKNLPEILKEVHTDFIKNINNN